MQLTIYENAGAGNLDATFAALADPTRRAILARLASGDASVTELTEPFAMSQPAISKHLRVLEHAGLISRTQDGQRRPAHIEAEALAEANEWLQNYRAFWEASFTRLDAVLAKMLTTQQQQKKMSTTKHGGRKHDDHNEHVDKRRKKRRLR
jgi:DNA-binding transcriptional ArsR family regulator